MLKKIILKSALWFVLFLILLEFALRIAGHFYLRKLYADLSGVERRKENINIVCLGESSTGGLWVDWNDSYPKQLEQRLRTFYGNLNIQVIVPPHVGQNTSQIANRIKGYMRMYKPRCVILMVGANNEWSLAESHICRFIPLKDKRGYQVRAMVAMSESRVFKLMVYLYLKYFKQERSEHMVSNRFLVWGHPENCRFPPQKWICSFAERNREALLKLWAYDVGKIIREAKKGGAQVLLMTYHLNPAYLPAESFLDMAGQEQVSLVRNDLAFQDLGERGVLGGYLLQDNWHPSKKGYALIAGNAFEIMRQNNQLNLEGGLE